MCYTCECVFFYFQTSLPISWRYHTLLNQVPESLQKISCDSINWEVGHTMDPIEIIEKIGIRPMLRKELAQRNIRFGVLFEEIVLSFNLSRCTLNIVNRYCN